MSPPFWLSDPLTSLKDFSLLVGFVALVLGALHIVTLVWRFAYRKGWLRDDPDRISDDYGNSFW